MIRHPAVIFSALAVSGCSFVPGTTAHARRVAESLVRQQMRDPASAQFRDERVVHPNGTVVVCGEVNGRNAYGGFSGFTRFLVAGGSAVVDPGPPAVVRHQPGRDVGQPPYEFQDAWLGAECPLPSPSR